MRKKGWNCLGFSVIYHFFFSYFLLLWVCHCCTCRFFVCAKSIYATRAIEVSIDRAQKAIKLKSRNQHRKSTFNFIFFYYLLRLNKWKNFFYFFFHFLKKKPILEYIKCNCKWLLLILASHFFTHFTHTTFFFRSAFHSNELYLIQFAVQRCKRYWNKIYTKLKKW